MGGEKLGHVLPAAVCSGSFVLLWLHLSIPLASVAPIRLSLGSGNTLLSSLSLWSCGGLLLVSAGLSIPFVPLTELTAL